MKTTRILALLAVALPLAFVSCSDDDDDDNGSSNGSGVVDESGTYNVDVTVLQGTDGNAYQLASISNGYYPTAYYYDSDGRCTSIYNWSWGDRLYLDFSEGGTFKGLYTDDEEESCSVSFNRDGYISKVSYTWVYDDETEKETTTYSYSDGRLTKVSNDVSYSWKENGHSYSDTYNGTLTLTWENGNLTKMKGSFTDKDGYDGESYSATETFTYEYGSTTNDGRQFLMAMVDMISYYDDFVYLFGMAGFMGKGSVNLPKSCTYVYKDSDGDDGDDSYSYSYTKNSNGLIRTEKFDDFSETFTYSYNSFGDDTRSAVTSPFEEIAPASTKAKVMGHHSRREKLKARHAAAKGTEE